MDIIIFKLVSENRVLYLLRYKLFDIFIRICSLTTNIYCTVLYFLRKNKTNNII